MSVGANPFRNGLSPLTETISKDSGDDTITIGSYSDYGKFRYSHFILNHLLEKDEFEVIKKDGSDLSDMSADDSGSKSTKSKISIETLVEPLPEGILPKFLRIFWHLLEGWTMEYDENGNPVYIHAETQNQTYDDPRITLKSSQTAQSPQLSASSSNEAPAKQKKVFKY